MRGPWLGVIADDVTGATDVGGHLVHEGGAVAQYFGVPESTDVPEGTECVIVALKSRSIPAKDAIEQSIQAALWLESLGVEHIYFKYCSTFDSTSDGNIGPVCEALARHRKTAATLVAPSAPLNGRTVYQGHLFVGETLLSRSALRDHPINPMRESDLRIVLAEQTHSRIELLPFSTVSRDHETVRAVVDGYAATLDDPVLVISDALNNDHLDALAALALEARLSSGSAGLAAALVRRRGTSSSGCPDVPQGHFGVISGSCSPVTREQVARYTANHPAFLVDPREVAAGTDVVGLAARFLREVGPESSPLVYASADPETVAECQRTLGVERSARLTEEALSAIAVDMVTLGIRRLLVAGGETSGSVVAALGISGVEVGTELAPGVPWTRTIGADPMMLVLKSGNFGSPDLFTEAAAFRG